MTNQTISVKKNTERIRICVLFLYLSPLFRQYHCHKPIATIFFSSYFDNAIATNQLRLFFFPFLFRQCHCHKFILTFFFPSISTMALPQTNCNNFFSLLFRQCHCHKSIPQFFFFLRNDMCTQFLQYFYNKF